MFIIKQTDTNIVLDSSDTIEYQPNNYPVVRPGTAYALAYYPNGIEQKSMGKVIGEVKKAFERADGKLIAECVKSKLA